ARRRARRGRCPRRARRRGGARHDRTLPRRRRERGGPGPRRTFRGARASGRRNGGGGWRVARCPQCYRAARPRSMRPASSSRIAGAVLPFPLVPRRSTMRGGFSFAGALLVLLAVETAPARAEELPAFQEAAAVAQEVEKAP